MCVQKVIQSFGGIRALARALGHANPSTVSGWYRRGSVPSSQIPIVMDAAQMRGIAIDASDFFLSSEVGHAPRNSFVAAARPTRALRFD